MMAERGEGVAFRAHAMRKGDGAERGVTDGRGVEAGETVLAEVAVIDGGQFHEEVVRVLAVDDGLAEGGFALLEDLGVIAARDRGRLKAEHGAKGPFVARGGAQIGRA